MVVDYWAAERFDLTVLVRYRLGSVYSAKSEVVWMAETSSHRGRRRLPGHARMNHPRGRLWKGSRGTRSRRALF